MNIKQPSPAKTTSRQSIHLTSSDEFDIPPASSISFIVAAEESGELDLDHTTSKDFTAFCRVCLNYKQQNLHRHEIKNITSFIRTSRNKNVFHWLVQQTSASNVKPRQNQGTNRDKVTGADEEATIGSCSSTKTSYLRPARAKPRAEATAILPDVSGRPQTTETTYTAVTLALQVCYLPKKAVPTN